MMLKKVKLSSLKPNPYRHFGTYEIQQEKVDSLKESIEASGFWGETVIARPVAKGYELAFGHHRWQAAIQHHGEDKMVDISVRDLNNDMMLKMMARENNEVYDANAAQDIELVKAVIEAHAKGEIHLPHPGNGVGKKGMHASDYIQDTENNSERFTQDALHEYLALDMWRIKEALGHLRQIKEKLTKPSDYDGLKPAQAQEMKTQIAKANAKAGPAVARKVAQSVSKALKKKKVVSGRGTTNPHSKTIKDVAETIVNKATGANTELHKFVRQIKATRDSINGSRIALQRLVDEMINKGVNEASGPEIGDLNKSIEGMLEEISYYREHFSTNKLKVIK